MIVGANTAMPPCKLTDEQYFAAMARIAAGELEAHVAPDYGMYRGQLTRLIRRRKGRGTLRTFWKPTLSLPADPGTLGYIAGIMDGEGSVVPVPEKHNSKKRFHIKIGMTDLALIEWLGGFGGTLSKVYNPPGNLPQRHWLVLRQSDVRTFLVALLPWLRVKRAKAEEAIRYIDVAMWEAPGCIPPGVVVPELPKKERAFRTETEKLCRTCATIKPVAEFPRNRAQWDGLQTQCASCINARRRPQRRKSR